jgi:hypothetical protein
MRKKPPPVLNVDLDRWGEGRDERLQRAYQHPLRPGVHAEWRWMLWCQEKYKRGRCNTFLGQVFATSEGLLWEAMVHGVAEWDLAFRSNAPRAQTSRLPAEFHANCQWLDDGDDDLRARCRRHEPITLPRSAVLEAIAKDLKRGHIRDGKLVLS